MFRLIVTVVLVWLAGCSQLPKYQRPSLPVPDQWAEVPNGPSKFEASQTHWRAFFVDPRLQALISSALTNNRDLRIAVARVQEARAQYSSARADKLPVISVGPAAGTTLVPGSSWPFANISYELDFWGRIAGLSESARFSYLASNEAQRAVHITLVADVASAYFELLQLEDQLALLRATLSLRQQSLDLTQKRLLLGATYDYEYQQAKGILESTLSSLAALEHQRTVANHRIDYLVGRVETELPAGLRLEEQGLDADISPRLPSTVLLLRPDVMAAELRLKAANANIGVARAALFPKIALSAGFGTLGSGPLSVLDTGKFGLTPLLSLPALFDGGRNEAGVNASNARNSIAVAEYERSIQLAFREVADQLSARASLSAQMRAIQANALSQEIRLKMAKSRYDLGAIAYFEVIDAQREYLASQQAVTSVRRAQLEAAVQLYKALGGGAQTNNAR